MESTRVSRILTCVDILLVMVIIMLGGLYLVSSQLISLLLFEGQLVEHDLSDYNRDEYEWEEQVASPDGSMIAIIEPRAMPEPYCTARIVIRDVSSFDRIATLECNGNYFFPAYATDLAWIDNDTIAFRSETSSSHFWKWRATLFPFGTVWLSIYAVVVIIGAVIGLGVWRRIRRSPLRVENPID